MMDNIARKINNARKMPPGDLVRAVYRLARHKVRGQTLRFRPVRLSDEKLLKAVGYKTLDSLLSRPLPPFFFEPDNRGKIAEIVRKEYPGSIKETVNDADEICQHVFDLLGSGKKELGKEIDWHSDFKSGFRWHPKSYYLGTGKHVEGYLKQGISADVKVPWELSRCQHLVTLGKAYWYTHDEKYAQEYVNQLQGWIAWNPVEFGVNWACTMDVAIRAVNWIWGYYFFCHSASLSREFKTELFKSLFLHGKHIINNLEFGAIRGNHYLSDIVGLIYLGIFFQETREGNRWLEMAQAALQDEMKFQVYPGGVDFEASVSYHRLVTELFLSATILCQKNSLTFPDWYMERLAGMVEFVMDYTKPDGTAPQIGDNDDGRLHILANYGNWNRLDHRYLLSAGAALFSRADFKLIAGKFHEEAFWLLGAEGMKKHNGLSSSKAVPNSKGLSDGGYYIMRQDSLYMVVDCLPANGKAPTGHRHNSRLSFELFAHDKSFIIDPGAYIYTADKEMRNLFRSTRYHNTVVVDGEEQNRFSEDELFSIGLEAEVKVNRWESTRTYDFLNAEHNGYSHLKNPVIHQRQVFFNKTKGYWLIRDKLIGQGEHQLELYFHFAPMEIELDNDFPMVVKTKTRGANSAIIPLGGEPISVEILKGWVSFRYGVKTEAPIVRYFKKETLPTSFYYAIYPYQGKIDIEKIRQEELESKVLPDFEGKP